MTVRAILFDIDGTLIDSNDLHVMAWQQAFAEIGVHLDRQALHNQIGKGTDMLVPSLLPDLGKDRQRELGKAHGRIFKARYLDQARPFARARDLLAHVHGRGQRIVLASSAARAELDHYLDLLDARDLVDEAVTSDDVDRTKPAPDIFAVALGKLDGIGAQEVVVLGDTPYDIEAAGKVGMAAIGVRSGGFADAVLTKAGAVALYEDVEALLANYATSPLA